jgi:two-component system, OmpR family, phosphate regulon response regulator PhoB
MLDSESPKPGKRSRAAGTVLRFADLVMSTGSYRVFRSNREVILAQTEFRLLRFLIENPHRVFQREHIVRAVWRNGRAIDDRTVDVHIARLRRAINGEGEGDLIRTVRGVGYALDHPRPQQGEAGEAEPK